jgi:hypothetical protein
VPDKSGRRDLQLARRTEPPLGSISENRPTGTPSQIQPISPAVQRNGSSAPSPRAAADGFRRGARIAAEHRGVRGGVSFRNYPERRSWRRIARVSSAGRSSAGMMGSGSRSSRGFSAPDITATRSIRPPSGSPRRGRFAADRRTFRGSPARLSARQPGSPAVSGTKQSATACAGKESIFRESGTGAPLARALHARAGATTPKEVKS